MITFRCSYKDGEGKMHCWNDEEHHPNQVSSPPKPKKAPKSITVKVKYLLSIKFFFKSKIVGLECRIKTDKGTELERIGNCDMSVYMILFLVVARTADSDQQKGCYHGFLLAQQAADWCWTMVLRKSCTRLKQRQRGRCLSNSS